MYSESSLLLLASIAGMLQLTGYLLYLRDEEIEPNPATWLMFAYGTLLLTLLEWDRNATLGELLLPTVCSGMAIVVAGRCWWRARRLDPSRLWPREWWPSDWRDRAAFQTDIVLTVLYVTVALLLYGDLIDEGLMELAVITFLLAANFTTISAFFPLIRNVFEFPDTERASPWIVWTCAYSLLGLTTYLTHGNVWTELMVYPVLNAILHGTVAVLARKSRRDLYPQAQASQLREPV